jgi:anti-sigma B factor antagonist
MEVEFDTRGQTGLVRIKGALLAGNADGFRQQFDPWFGQAGCRHVVADLSELEVLDSTGLGHLIASLKRVSEKGGDLKLAGLQKRVRLVFEITRTYRVFEIFDTVEEALQAAGA